MSYPELCGREKMTDGRAPTGKADGVDLARASRARTSSGCRPRDHSFHRRALQQRHAPRRHHHRVFAGAHREYGRDGTDSRRGHHVEALRCAPAYRRVARAGDPPLGLPHKRDPRKHELRRRVPRFRQENLVFGKFQLVNSFASELTHL